MLNSIHTSMFYSKAINMVNSISFSYWVGIKKYGKFLMQIETNKRNKKATCKCDEIQFQAYPCCSKMVAEKSVTNTCLHGTSYGTENRHEGRNSVAAGFQSYRNF